MNDFYLQEQCFFHNKIKKYVNDNFMASTIILYTAFIMQNSIMQ